MPQTRRSILAAIGAALPFGLTGQSRAADSPVPPAPSLRFQTFEAAVRAAFDQIGESAPWRRVEVGSSPLIQAGVQGCHNDRPFAGFPAGHLRIIRTGSEPGPTWQGVRLYVTTVDVFQTQGQTTNDPSRPLDFASIPAAPMWV